MLQHFRKPCKASFILGGQWGSEGKGAAAAFTALKCGDFDIATTNAGAQAGHTSTHNGVTKVVFHLPTYALYQPAFTYLNAGSIIDPVGLLRELDENPQIVKNGFAIHPNAAIITQECKDAEGRDDSAQTRIASTRKGVGEALSRKVLRSGVLAKDLKTAGSWWTTKPVSTLHNFVRRLDLNDEMRKGKSVLVEVPQGHSLSIDGPFYPHTTSRNCTVMQGMSDAGIHPSFYHRSMLVIRTFPIRVGNIERPVGQDGCGTGYEKIGYSGDCFPDQWEVSWEQLGQKPEITTVTKRVRRVFTFSEEQVMQAIAQTRPAVIYLTFCDYLPFTPAETAREMQSDQHKYAKAMVAKLREMCARVGSICNDGPEILTQWGPTTADVIRAEDL